MIVAVCVDNNGGMTFCGKRQSLDSLLIKDFMTLSKGKAVISPFSASLFKDYQIKTDENFLMNAKRGEYCFVENKDITPYVEKIEKIVVYNWNRDYPSTQKFTMPDGFKLKKTVDFSGNSHDKITRQIYAKEVKANG